MDVQSLISEFVSSEHGSNATDALAQAGVTGDQAQQILAAAAGAGHAQVEESGSGLLGAAPGKSFFAAFAAGIVKGDGVFGSLEDGAEGVLVGRIAQAIGSEVGIDPATAQTLAAAVTPFVASFIKKKLS